MTLELSGKTVLVTGATGALGAHVILRLLELGANPKPLDLRSEDPLHGDCDAVIHLAAVNRASDPADLSRGNANLAEVLLKKLNASDKKPLVIAYANSTQTLTNDSLYSRGKSAAAKALDSWCASNGASFHNVLLPNLIGEFGRPFHNMVSTTIIEHLINPTRELTLNDSELRLLELQAAAEAICSGTAGEIEPNITTSPLEMLSVAERLLGKIRQGIFPDLSNPLDSRIYGMLVEASFRLRQKLFLPVPRVDARGTFTELGRIEGGRWQVSNVTISPGATRGNHFHRRMIENFTVTSGAVTVGFGRSWSGDTEGETVELTAGESITFPIGWWHSFTNFSDLDANISIVSNRWFDPLDPDTVPCQGILK